MPDIRGLVSDPGFEALSPEDKRDVLGRAGADPMFVKQVLGEDIPAMAGGSEAMIGPATSKPSAWDEAREYISQAIFGDPDREEARAAGIGLQPTPADMAGAVGRLGLDTAAMAGPALLGPMAGTGLKAAGLAAARTAGVAGLGMGGAAVGGSIGRKLGQWSGIPYADTAGFVIGSGIGGMLGGGAAAGASKAASRAAGAAKAAKSTARAAKAGDVIEAEILSSRPVVTPPPPVQRALPPAQQALPAAPVAAPAASAAPALNPADIQQYVLTMRNQHGLSGAQITDFLRSQFGIPVKDGRQVVKMILEAQGK